MKLFILTVLALAAIIGYYFLMFKPKQNAKISKETKGTRKVVAPDKPDAYAEIINDFPTYHRQDRVK